MKRIITMALLLISNMTFAEGDEASTQYRYKQYEKIDFDDLSIGGELGSPGDLSVSYRYEKEFKNKLPFRKNFHPEMKQAIDRVK